MKYKKFVEAQKVEVDDEDKTMVDTKKKNMDKKEDPAATKTPEKEKKKKEEEDLEEDTMSDIKRWFSRNTKKKQYEKVVRLFLDLRKKNPGKAGENLRKAAQMSGADIRTIDKVLRDMVKDGAMPKHLLNYPTLQMEAKSGDKEAYQKFFQSALKKFGVKSPAELDDDKEKEFYNYIDKNWKSDDEMSEKYRKPTQAEIDADRKKDGKGQEKTRYQRIKKKMYGNAMGGLKEEEDLNENKIFFVKVGDGRDFMTVKTKAANKSDALKKVRSEYPKDKVSLDINQKQGRPAGAFESAELEEATFMVTVPKGGPKGKDLNVKVDAKDKNAAVKSFRSMYKKFKNDTVDVKPVKEEVELDEANFADFKYDLDIEYRGSPLGDRMSIKKGKGKQVIVTAKGRDLDFTFKKAIPNLTGAKLVDFKVKGMDHVGIYEATMGERQVLKAVRIAKDMGGDMTGAVRKIEKMKKGLSDHPKVQDALRLANESVKESYSSFDERAEMRMGELKAKVQQYKTTDGMTEADLEALATRLGISAVKLKTLLDEE